MKSVLTSSTHFRASIFAVLLLISLSDRVSGQWASDSTFINSNWTSTVLPNISTATAKCGLVNSSGVTTCQCGQDAAGNLTQSRKTCHSYSWPPYPAAIWVAHLYQPTFYNPSTQGAITGLSYSYDLRQYTASGGQNVTHKLLVYQNFTYYGTSVNDLIGLNSWQPFSRSNLTATSFVKMSGPSSTPQHPNFSCKGSVIQFGYLTGNSNTNPTISAMDNWKVYLVRGAPCPCP